MISSMSNGKVKQAAALSKRAKARREQGLFVVEGIKMFQEIPEGRLEAVFASESFLRRPGQREMLAGMDYEAVTDQVFAAMSDTKSPQGILALVRQEKYQEGDLLPREKPAFLLLLEGLQDPGNLGTILRAGEGAGVTGVIMSGGTADIYNPKVIRSTMGSVYRVPFLYAEDFAGTLKRLKEKQVRLLAAHLEGEQDYDREDYAGDIGFLIGNESAGLTEEASSLADGKIKIPMLGRVESLNAAVAASILMYEAARQRRSQGFRHFL